jgi:hypothetical protein
MEAVMEKKQEWWPKELTELSGDLLDFRDVLIEKAEADAVEVYELEEKNDEKHTEDVLFSVRAEVVKGFRKALKSVLEDTETNFNRELQYRNKKLPYRWMLNNKKILAAMNKYPIVSALNFIDQRSRGKKGKSFTEMEELNRKVTGGKKYEHPNGKGPYEFASFLVTAAFLEFAAKEVGCKPNYIQKLIQAFCKAGILKKLGRNGSHGGTLYADGYFANTKVGLRKFKFLKETKEFRNELAQFNPK